MLILRNINFCMLFLIRPQARQITVFLYLTMNHG